MTNIKKPDSLMDKFKSWVEIEGLKEAHFHNHGRLILDSLSATGSQAERNP